MVSQETRNKQTEKETCFPSHTHHPSRCSCFFHRDCFFGPNCDLKNMISTHSKGIFMEKKGLNSTKFDKKENNKIIN